MHNKLQTAIRTQRKISLIQIKHAKLRKAGHARVTQLETVGIEKNYIDHYMYSDLN